MELSIVCVVTVVALVILQTQSTDCQTEYTINDCDSYRDVYETFSSCAIFAMYNSSERNTVLFDKDVLDRQDLIDVVNYWCSVLEMASGCTIGGSLQCINRHQIASVVSNTGGVCKSGKLNEAFKSFIPATFSYNTKCLSTSLDVTESCETLIPKIEYNISIDDGVQIMMRTIQEVLDCNSNQLRRFGSNCDSPSENVVFFTLRSLAFSVPHALGVDLSLSTVMDIIN